MSEHLRATLVDGSEHILAPPVWLTPKQACNLLYEGTTDRDWPKPWLLTTKPNEYIKRDAIVRLTLESELPLADGA